MSGGFTRRVGIFTTRTKVPPHRLATLEVPLHQGVRLATSHTPTRSPSTPPAHRSAPRLLTAPRPSLSARSTMALRSLTLLCAAAGASAGAIELTPDNFDELVLKSGKAAFIKFLAPW